MLKNALALIKNPGFFSCNHHPEMVTWLELATRLNYFFCFLSLFGQV